MNLTPKEKSTALHAISTVEELRTAVLPQSWAALARRRSHHPNSALLALLDSAKGRTLAESAFILLHGVGECAVCRAIPPFAGWKKGYAEHCSRACHGKNTELQLASAEQRSQVMLARYGSRGTLGSAELLKKVQATNIEKYGVLHGQSSAQAGAKRKATNMALYGGNSPNSNSKIAAKQGLSKRLNSQTAHVQAADAAGFKLIFGDPFGQDAANWLCPVGHKITWRWRTSQCSPICRACTPLVKGTSAQEQELAKFVKSLVSIEQNTRLYYDNSVKHRYFELDIYVPNSKIAIEYNGLYWHSELSGKGPDYHLNKLECANERGINLIQIFEHEWKAKQELCMSILKAKLGLSVNRTSARKLELVKLSKKDGADFFEQFHLAGNAAAENFFGLIDGTQIMAAASYRADRYGRDKSVVELIRFAVRPSWSIAGALSRLTTAGQRCYTGRKLRTFCDRRWSSGNGYLQAGWSAAGSTKPGYWYFSQDNKVYHRSKFQKKKLLEITGGTQGTEWELAQQIGLNRFWDCGHLMFEKDAL